MIKFKPAAMIALLIANLIVLTPVFAGDDALKSVFLVDNSGSMLPYYTDREKRLHSLVGDIIENCAGSKDNLSVLLLNGVHFKRLNDKFTPAKDRNGRYAGTNLNEALDNAIGILNGAGVIWVLTDNINDPEGQLGTGFESEEDIKGTTEFYKRLKNDLAIRRIVCYPVIMPVKDPNLLNGGLVLYSILYSRNELSHTETQKYVNRMQNSKLRETCKEDPVFLKPLDITFLGLKHRDSNTKEGKDKELYLDGAIAELKGFEENKEITAVFEGDINVPKISTYQITDARLSANVISVTSTDPSLKEIDSQSIKTDIKTDFSPNKVGGSYTIAFTFPKLRPKFFTTNILSDTFHIKGFMTIELSGIRLQPDKKFIDRVKRIYAMETMSQIFIPSIKDGCALIRMPFDIEVRYEAWRFWAAVSMILVVVLILLTAIYVISFKKAKVTISVDGEEKSFKLSSLSRGESIYPSDDSFSLGVVKMGFLGGIYFKKGALVDYGSPTCRGKRHILPEGESISVIYKDTDLKEHAATITRKKEDDDVLGASDEKEGNNDEIY